MDIPRVALGHREGTESMATLVYNDRIFWPNGEGETPCTKEYADAMAAKDAIFDPNYDEGTSENLSPEDYQRYCELDNALMTMQANGHLGKSIRY